MIITKIIRNVARVSSVTCYVACFRKKRYYKEDNVLRFGYVFFSGNKFTRVMYTSTHTLTQILHTYTYKYIGWVILFYWISIHGTQLD